jgi:hypothetical protein
MLHHASLNSRNKLHNEFLNPKNDGAQEETKEDTRENRQIGP